MDDQFSLENAFYFSDEYAVNALVTVEAGIRIPIFMSFGPAEINLYDPSRPKDLQNVTGVKQFGKGEIIKTFAGIEPRISMRRLLNSTSSLKFGYHRMYQYLHLVTNTASVTPIDIWQPSGYY
ncbi:MAG: hypothetical protein AAF412_07585, partial [Pseudomonadota bacterium]